MHHSAKAWIAKIEAMLDKAKNLQQVVEETLEETGSTDPLLHNTEYKYIREDIQALARDIANDGN
jgi:hypothetical protein